MSVKEPAPPWRDDTTAIQREIDTVGGLKMDDRACSLCAGELGEAEESRHGDLRTCVEALAVRVGALETPKPKRAKKAAKGR